MAPSPPGLKRILETVLYVGDTERAERFYTDVMRMRLLDREPGRSLFYRAGDSVLLLFVAKRSLRSAKLPPHGAEGPVHICFEAAGGDYEAWKEQLATHGVEVVQETRWAAGRSFYFRDPDGNLLEIADTDIWPA